MRPELERGSVVWKQIAESLDGFVPAELSHPRSATWPWRRILADAALLAAFALTSSLLLRG